MTVSSGIPDSPPKSFMITDATSEAFRLVAPNSGSTVYSNKATIATANTDNVIGILLESVTAANQIKPVQTNGIGILRVNGASPTISAGQDIVATTGGIGVPAATASATLQRCIGTALQPASADDVLIEVLINPKNLVKGTA